MRLTNSDRASALTTEEALEFGNKKNSFW